jgi:N-acetylglucosamine-6-phosphate deacetylase
MTKRFFTGCRVFTGETIVSGLGVVVEDGQIVALSSEPPTGADVLTLPEDSLLAPGFLDLQVNGAGGVLLNDDPSPRTVRTIARTVRRFGVTGVLPTFITGPKDAMLKACASAAEAMAEPGSGVLGIHLEGPFISADRRGIHDLASVRAPQADDVEAVLAASDRLQAAGGRLLLTLAPEAVDDATLSRFAAAGVVLSVGHTAANFERTQEALALGARCFTHLTNAMPPIHNRDPGPVVAALDSHDAWCGLIADGHHVHPGLMRAIVAAKPGKVFLVTDAMAPLGTTADSFVLDGRTIFRRDGRLASAEGVLAGADIDMVQSVRNVVALLNQPVAEALRMASLYPAACLGIDNRYGRIAPGYKADFALLDAQLAVSKTWIGGRTD